MPEGPEVKTVARTLANEIVGKELGSLWHSHYRLRQEVNYQALKRCENLSVDGVSCYGKVIFINANKQIAIVAQLGMTGQLKVEPVDAPLMKHTHIRWPLKNTNKELRYVDPRRFGLFAACDEKTKSAIMEKLGPDPFNMKPDDHRLLIKSMHKSSRNIKEVLLDQTIIAGIGNIYASEALFLAKISPTRRALDVNQQEYERLIPAIIEVLDLAYKNGGTTFSNYVDGTGQKGKNLQFLQVFQRAGQPCLVCGELILRIKQAGRSTFYCPQCQR